MCGNSKELAYKKNFSKPEITYFLLNFSLHLFKYASHHQNSSSYQ